MEYLQAFLVGSSAHATLPFFATVAAYPPGMMRFRYRDYTLVAPLYLGAMNAAGKYLSNQMGFGLLGRILLTWIMSASIVSAIITTMPAYTFTTPAQWRVQYWGVFRAHLLVQSLSSILDQLIS